MDTFAIAKDVVIAMAAFVGAGLGLFNFIHERKKERVRLRVTPKAVMTLGTTETGQEARIYSDKRIIDRDRLSSDIAIEIVNLSRFSVEVDQVGFLLNGSGRRLCIFDPDKSSGADWPKRIEARGKATVHGNLSDLLNSEDVGRIECAFAETSCGHVEKGSSEVFPALLKLREGKP